MRSRSGSRPQRVQCWVLERSDLCSPVECVGVQYQASVIENAFYFRTMDVLRFHWDVMGMDAERTAVHFEKHLKEFCGSEHIEPFHTWIRHDGGRRIVTLECAQKHLVLVRDRLKPQRAERVLDDV